MRAITLLAFLGMAVVPLAGAETDTSDLYDIAKQAQIQVEIQISPLHPSEIGDLLEQGTARVDAITNSTDHDEAAEHFLAAMQMFEEAFRLMDEAEASSIEDITPDHSEDLARVVRYYDQLQYLASVYDLDVDNTQLDSLFAQARTQVENDESQAAQTLESIKEKLAVLRERIGVAAAEEDRTRALEYAARYMKKLDRLVAGADTLEIPPEAVEDLQRIRDLLAVAADPSTIISLIREAISIKQDLDLAENDRLEVWVWQLEDTIDRLSDDDIIDNLEYNAAVISLDRCKDMLADGDLDKAEIRLGQINDWLFDLEQSRG